TGRGAIAEDVRAPGVPDGHGRVELLRFGADVVLPHDLPGARLQGDDEPASRAAGVRRVGPHGVLVAAAGDHHQTAGQDRRREDAVGGVAAGEGLDARVDLPALPAGGPVQRVDGAAEVADVDRVVGDEGRVHEAGGGQAGGG